MLICNNGAIILQFLDSPCDEPIRASDILRWIESELCNLPSPSGWQFMLPLAEIAYEQTTLVFCDVHGDETVDSPVDFSFTEGEGMSEIPQTLRLLVFVCKREGRYAVMGALLSSTFFGLMDSGAFVSYGDIMVRETRRLFEGVEAFDEIDYFYLFDRVADTCPPLIDSICHAVLNTWYQVMNRVGVPPVAPEMQPYAFQYMIFAMSATDELAEVFIAYEKERFVKRLEALKHNPYLQLELCRKWLRVDWRATRMIELATSISEVIEKESDREALYACSRAHFPSALANPSHYVEVRLHHFLGAHPHLRCGICGEKWCTARPPIKDGFVLIPLHCVAFAGINALGMMLRKWIQSTRREYRTHDALTMWVQDSGLEKWKIWTREAPHDEVEVFQWGRELVKGLSLNANDRATPEGIRSYIRASLETRDHFALLFDRDPAVLERVIIGEIWASQCGLIADFPVLKRKRIDPVLETKIPIRIAFGAMTPGVLDKASYTEINTHEALLAYTSMYWPPCMHRIVETAIGSKHLKHRRRLMVGRFLLSQHLPYTREEACRFWELIWTASDIYKRHCPSSDAFWLGEYGLCFTNLIKNPYAKKTWPFCKTMLTADLCPYVDEVVDDIEDVVGKAQERCTRELLAHRRMQLQKKPNSLSWQLFFPAAFTKNLHTFN